MSVLNIRKTSYIEFIPQRSSILLFCSVDRYTCTTFENYFRRHLTVGQLSLNSVENLYKDHRPIASGTLKTVYNAEIARILHYRIMQQINIKGAGKTKTNIPNAELLQHTYTNQAGGGQHSQKLAGKYDSAYLMYEMWLKADMDAVCGHGL